MKLFKKIAATEKGDRYLHDKVYRSGVGIYQGMTVNLVYGIFRAVIGVIYSSVWLISTAAYFLVLGFIRMGLAVSKRKNGDEHKAYRRTAWLLLLLDIPLGGMILLMIRTETGIVYPGYTIYAAAAYTFYMLTLAIINVVKFKKLGSPLLSAAKALNLVSALVSILGLQNALISMFSANAAEYRQLMNTLTGTGLYIAVIVISLYMLSKRRPNEQIGE